MNPIHLAAARVGGLLAAAAPGSDINTGNIIGWCASHILPILIFGVGAWAISRATKGESSKVVTAIGIVGLGVIVIGAAGLFAAFGDSMAHKIFG